MPKKGGRRKHIPQRTCVGCREVSSKRDLLRLVRTEIAVLADPSGKLNGRGAYVHANQDCLQSALKGGLEKALRTKLSADDLQAIEKVKQSLPAKRKIEPLVETAENG